MFEGKFEGKRGRRLRTRHMGSARANDNRPGTQRRLGPAPPQACQTERWGASFPAVRCAPQRGGGVACSPLNTTYSKTWSLGGTSLSFRRPSVPKQRTAARQVVGKGGNTR